MKALVKDICIPLCFSHFLFAVSTIEALFLGQANSASPLTEIAMRDFYWAPLVNFLFRVRGISTYPEYPVSAMGNRSRRTVDYAVVERITGRHLPLLFVEIGKSPLRSPSICHKDEQRMAQMMRLSLKMRLKYFRASPISELAKMRAYGLLIGGFDVELCEMLPQLEILPDEQTCSVKFVFCTSRDTWRFSFLELPPPAAADSIGEETVVSEEEEESDTAASNSLDSNTQGLPRFVCDGADEQIFYFNPSQNCGQSPFDASDPSSTASAEILSSSTTNADDAALMLALNRHGVINRTAIRAVAMVQGRILKQTELSLIPARGSSDDSSGSGVDSSSHSVDEGRSGHSSGTPSKRSRSTSSSRSSRQPPRKASRSEGETLIDPFPHPTVDVKKPQDSSDEVGVYLHPSISASDCFPKLVSFAILDEGATIKLTLERILTWKPFLKAEKENWLLPRLIIKFLKEIGEALGVLHGAGFVHGDVSPNNVGYNERLGRFQLFDFNHSRSVEEAGRYKRRGGTRGFRSISYERSWLFSPQDDYVSLYLCALVMVDEYPERPEELLKVLMGAVHCNLAVSQVIEGVEQIVNNSCK